MATSDINLADRSGNLVESHKNYDPRIVFFYFIIAALLLTLAGGLAYQQLSKTGEYADAERQQNQRRVLFPGPRGNIYDRNGKVLVENRPRFEVVLHLNELKDELRREHNRIYKNFLAAGAKKDVPSGNQLKQIARVTLVQRYLDQVNEIVGRSEKVNATSLRRHFDQQLLLPYKLLENLEPKEYAQLIERLPVRSPLEVYAGSVRWYPHGAAAAHTLGYVRPDSDVEAEGFTGSDLTTFKMEGTRGKDGLEKWFDAQLQGEAGGRIYRVDPTGYKISKPLEERKPKQGKHLTTSLDIDLQLAAETALGDQRGAAVAIDVATGEVLVMASKPEFADLNKFSPRASVEAVADLNTRRAWTNLAMNGVWPPGSTFKILTSIAALRRGTITPVDSIINCNGYHRIGGRVFVCDNGRGHHGDVLLPHAIAISCDIYYFEAGKLTTPAGIAEEGRRFHLDRPTGIELPSENHRTIMPDPEWKLRVEKERWYPGDTANMAIGQGDVLVTPLHMACFTASVARGEVFTQPTLVHQPNRPTQKTESIGLKPEERAALLEGMLGCTTVGTAKSLTNIASRRIPGVQIAGKTGTAQAKAVINGKFGTINYAWFICFAPIEKPEIAIAVAIEGDTLGENFGGGEYAAPVANTILKKYFEKKAEKKSGPPQRSTSPLKTE
jgi:penicillin-binding protein 2